MNKPHPICLLSLGYEGGSVDIMTDEVSPNAPVFRQTSESYDLDEEELAGLSLSSSTKYPNIAAYWETFTDSSYWFMAHLLYLRPLLFELVRQSLREVDPKIIAENAYKIRRWQRAIEPSE